MTLRSALEESDRVVAQDQWPSARLVQGPPACIGDTMSDFVLAEAKTEYLGFDDRTYLAWSGLEGNAAVRGSRTMIALIERGVRVRQVATGRHVNTGSARSTRSDAGGARRAVAELPAKACVVDRRFALVPVDLSTLAYGLLIITDPTVVKVLVAAHHTLWEASNCPGSDADSTPEHLVAVLGMLASGLTDDRAAERLGLSSRTYSRRVAELMGTLGAESRFEAGVEAARRGWL
jgi:hypothetical protein